MLSEDDAAFLAPVPDALRARDAERELQRAVNRFEAAVQSLEQLGTDTKLLDAGIPTCASHFPGTFL